MNRDWPEALDRAAARGERFTAWRKQRHMELELGLDIEALAVTLDTDPSEWHLQIAGLCVLTGIDNKLLKLDEIKRRLVESTLKREEQSWKDS